MINIRLEIRRECLYVRAQGHSLFDKKGQDLICCAVSTLVDSWYLSSYELGGGTCKALRKDGFFEAEVSRNEKNELLFKALFVSLMPLREQFPSNIILSMEEQNGS